MTEPEPEIDARLWRLRWRTLNGLQRAALYCTNHKQRHESACVSMGLPRPTSEQSTATTGRCRQCVGPRSGGRSGPMFDRTRPAAGR